MSRTEDDHIEWLMRQHAGAAAKPAQAPAPPATAAGSLDQRLRQVLGAIADAESTLRQLDGVSKVRPGDRSRINSSHGALVRARPLLERIIADVAPSAGTAEHHSSQRTRGRP